METATPPVKTAVMSSVALAELSNVVGNNLVDVIVVILVCALRLQRLHYNLSLWTLQKHISKGGSKKLSIKFVFYPLCKKTILGSKPLKCLLKLCVAHQIKFIPTTNHMRSLSHCCVLWYNEIT